MRRGWTQEPNAEVAARDLADQVAEEGTSTVIVFASPDHDADALAAALHHALRPAAVYGCTTAGEIGPRGFRRGSIVALSLRSDEARVGAGLACRISGSPISNGRRATLEAIADLGLEAGALSSRRHVAVTLIDGRSGQEESFIAGASAGAPRLELVGGSASDGLEEEPAARVFCGREAYRDCGLVLLFETALPFTCVVTEHMIPGEERVVVTAADTSERLVHELNGKPAREMYGELLHHDGPVDRALAAPFPFGYYVGGRPYVRSVMAVVGDSLRFACAVDEGAVLRLMHPGDMLETTKDALEAASDRVGGEMTALLAFHCLGRFLECENLGTTDRLGAILADYPVVGFNTFGEQVNALHVNHTLTGLAFGGSGGG